MQKRKSLFALMMVLFMIPCALSLPRLPLEESAQGRAVTVAAKTSASEEVGHFYAQLDATAQGLYREMAGLYASGALKTGNGSVDLVSKNVVSQTQLKNFIYGDASLKTAFQNARDAFEKDYYDIFYVDFTKLTLRVGKSGEDYLAYINAGSNADYYAKGFASADQVNRAVADAEKQKLAIVDEIKAAQAKAAEENKILTQAQIVELAHNLLVQKLEYTYPSAQNQFVAGVYALADAKANCVGYSSALKWVLESFDIETALVAGNAVNSLDVTEAHMWNYVKIDSAWFAVDVTWDDPIAVSRGAEIKTEYLLKGAFEFDLDHFPLGVFSPNGMTFAYPILNELSYENYVGTKLEDTSTDLKVYTTKDVDHENVTQTKMIINYLNKTLETLQGEGLYLAMRFAYAAEGFQKWVPFDAYMYGTDGANYTFTISKEGSIQFCITPLHTAGMSYDVDLSAPGNHVVLTDPFRLPYYSSYVAPPFIRTSEPSLAKRVDLEKTHYTVEFDDELIPDGSGKPVDMDVTSTENVEGKVTNLRMTKSSFTLPNQTTRVSTVVDFDFDPEDVYQNYINIYNLQLRGVVGKSSQKAPNVIPICVSFKVSIPCPTYVAAGAISNEAFVVAMPILVVNDNMNIFEYDDKEAVAGAMDIRLIASIPNDKEKDKMLDASNDSDVLSSSVYELSLGCQNQLARLKTDADYNVTIGLPFPEGFNYKDNQNVEFKAYHYRRQPDGSFVAEELICRVTARGLEVLVKDFSPFSIVAVPKSGQSQNAKKFLNVEVKSAGGDVMRTVAGGSISAAGLHVLAANETKTFAIEAKAGYVADRILLNGKPIQANNGVVTLDYASVAEDNTLEVGFIAETVKTAEAVLGFDAVNPNLSWTGKKPIVELDGLKFTGKTFSINPFKPNAKFELTLGALPAGYRVVYSNNTATKAGTYTATATIYRLTAAGTDDESVDPLILTAEFRVRDNSTWIIVSIVAGALVVIAAGSIFSILYIKKKKGKENRKVYKL